MANLQSLLARWRDYNGYHRTEGDTGLKQLEELCECLGYVEDLSVKYGDSISLFLSDNPGAVAALYEWVEKQNVPEWRERLDMELPDDHEDEDDDHEDEDYEDDKN